MKTRKKMFPGLFGLFLAAVMGCEMITPVDRSKIPDTGGNTSSSSSGSGGSGGGNTSSSSSGSGGSGGGNTSSSSSGSGGSGGGSSNLPTGASLWETHPVSNVGSSDFRNLKADTNGGVVGVGNLTGTIDFGGGPLTSSANGGVFLVKLDTNGNHVCSTSFGQAGMQRVNGIALDSQDNVYVTGSFTDVIQLAGGITVTSAGSIDYYLIKFSSDCTPLLAKSFGDQNDQKAGTGQIWPAIDSTGNVVIAGGFYGTIDFGNGPMTSNGNSDTFVAQFDSNGKVVWAKTFGDVNTQYVQAVSIDGNGKVVIVGSFDGDMNFGSGSLTGSTLGTTDIFVAKFDSNGNSLFAKKFGDGADQYTRDVAIGNDGSIIITGAFIGTINFGGGELSSPLMGGNDATYDIYLTKLDANGNHLWSKVIKGPGVKFGFKIDVDSEGRVAIAGYFHDTVDFGNGPISSKSKQDIFVAQFTANGALIWARTFAGNATDASYVRGMAYNKDEDIVLGGTYKGNVSFPPLASLPTSSVDTVFVATFDASGNH